MVTQGSWSPSENFHHFKTWQLENTTKLTGSFWHNHHPVFPNISQQIQQTDSVALNINYTTKFTDLHSSKHIHHTQKTIKLKLNLQLKNNGLLSTLLTDAFSTLVSVPFHRWFSCGHLLSRDCQVGWQRVASPKRWRILPKEPVLLGITE